MDLFYRGDLDHKRVTAPNGAIVNEDYLAFLSSGGWAGATVHRVREGVHSVVGYSLSNYTFVEGDNGLIVFDTGNNMGMGREVLRLIREVVDKPISAIIYSHHHYTGGAQAFAEVAGDAELSVYGHPDLEANLRSTSALLGPMQFRRAGIQLGFYLSHEGPDAVLAPAEPTFDDPALMEVGHVEVTHPVADGEEVMIDGVRVVFYQVVADTRDSIIAFFPDFDLALHNTALAPIFYPLYTLRGDFYRNPPELIAGVDKLRELRPTYTVGCHGNPILSKEEGYEIATAHRDAYAFIYNQSIRAINAGMTPDEMANTIRLPQHLAEHPWLFPGYIDIEYAFRGQYRGIVGWFSEDTADLHPPTPEELGATIVEGFGGIEPLVDTARDSFEQRKYNLAAKLLSFVLSVEPEHSAARQLKADALRAMAQTTRSGIQTRNFLLTHALHLEKKLDWTRPPESSILGGASVETVLNAPPGTYVKLLEVLVDPEASNDIDTSFSIEFSDLERAWTVHIRRGVVEVAEVDSADTPVVLSLPRLIWAEMMLGQNTLEDALASGRAQVRGEGAALAEAFGAFQMTAPSGTNRGDF